MAIRLSSAAAGWWAPPFSWASSALERPSARARHTRAGLDRELEARGADVVTDGVARFDGSGMLRLVAGASRRRHVLTLVTSDPGVRAFAFTFGP